MLTEIACKSAMCLPGKARARLTDAGGLYLEISPTGFKRWFWKYRFATKEKRLALGTYSAVSLKQTRSERDLARRTLQSGRATRSTRCCCVACVHWPSHFLHLVSQ